jgi:Leucine-rich repeat (LRR) protein
MLTVSVLLQVLYIYDNLLSSIAGIASSRLLTHLVCHNNQLTSLQGL